MPRKRRVKTVKTSVKLIKNTKNKIHSNTTRTRRTGRTTTVAPLTTPSTTASVIPTPNSIEKYDKPIIFFDNDIRITSGFLDKCSKIITIKVYESDQVVPLNTIDEQKLPPDIPTNPAYLYYKTNYDLAELHYDIYGGLQEIDRSIIQKWLVDSDMFEERTAIFDFDRTITIIDGFDPVAEIKGQFTQDEHMEFLCGGSHRILWLKDFFSILMSNNINIKICTNNPGCSYDRMKTFMNILGVSLKSDDIVCAVVEDNIHEDLKNANIPHSSKYKITALEKRGIVNCLD
jgi:hypothetical protein